MQINMMKSKIHRAQVTDADLNYEGSITIDRALCEAAKLLQFEQVDIYNVNTGARLTTYVIYGRAGQICLNGAAARLVQRGDLVIIASYCSLEMEKALLHKPTIVLVDGKNKIKEIKAGESHHRLDAHIASHF